jgi:hypothetical protein
MAQQASIACTFCFALFQSEISHGDSQQLRQIGLSASEGSGSAGWSLYDTGKIFNSSEQVAMDAL